MKIYWKIIGKTFSARGKHIGYQIEYRWFPKHRVADKFNPHPKPYQGQTGVTGLDGPVKRSEFLESIEVDNLPETNPEADANE